MRARRSLPIRLRLTAAFVAGLFLVLVGLSWFVYVRTSNNLLDAVDSGLRSRAEALAGQVRAHGPSFPSVDPTLLERDEAFAQITDPDGQVLRSSAIVRGLSIIPPSDIRSLHAPAWHDESLPQIDNVTRVLAVPVTRGEDRYVVLVGASLQDRRDQVLQLGATLAVAGVVLLVVSGLGAWWLVGAALRPVDQMRRQADSISAAEPDVRLAVAKGSDEIAELGTTLNAMLDRIEQAVTSERDLVDRASHELRTPLAIQRMALDLAISGPQTTDELGAALRGAHEENRHLARIADDLLVLSRARGGRLAARRQPSSLSGLLEESVERNRARAAKEGVQLSSSTADVSVLLDPDWIRQALDNLVNNALRATPDGGHIELTGAVLDGDVRITVEDSGPGFDEALLPHAFDPFTSGGSPDAPSTGAGLGLAIVRAIAQAHGGKAVAENTGQGARVTISLPSEGNS